MGAALGCPSRGCGGLTYPSLTLSRKAGAAIAEFWRSLPADLPHWRRVATLMSGTIGSQIVGACSMLFLARMYSPAQFGIYAFFFTVASLLSLVSTGRYEQATFLAQDDEEAAGTAGLSAALSIAVALVVLLISPLLDDFIGRAGELKALKGQSQLLALAVATGGLVLSLNALGIQQRQYRTISLSRMVQSIATAGVSVGLAVSGWSSNGLIVGLLAGQMAGVLAQPSQAQLMLRHFNRSNVIKRARDHFDFPRFTLIADLLNYLGYNLLSMLTPAYFGTAVLGQYNLGQRVAALPMTFVGRAMADTFRSDISPLRASDEELPIIFRRTAIMLGVLGIAITLPIAIFGPDLFEFVFGKKWHEAGIYSQILSPILFAKFLVSPLAVVLYRLKKQALVAKLQGLFVVAVVIAVVLGTYYGSYKVVLYTIAVLHTLIYGVFLLASGLALKRFQLASKGLPQT